MSDEKFRELANAGICAVVGTGLSLAPGSTQRILSNLIQKYAADQDIPRTDFWSAITSITSSSQVTSTELRACLKTLLRRSRLGRWLPDFCRTNLRAVISLTPDPHLGESLQQELSRTPAISQVQRITTGAEQPKRGYLPLYMTIGDSEFTEASSKIPVTTAEFLARKRVWRSMLSDFKDIAKSRPIVCVGLENELGLLHEVLNELLESYPTLGRALYFIDGNEVSNDQTLIEMIGQSPQTLDSDVWSVLATANSSSQFVIKSPASISAASLSDVLRLRRFDITDFSLVPSSDDLSNNECGRNQAIDLLFQPGSLDWNPYSQDLDFQREQLGDLLHRVSHSVETARAGAPEVLLLRGEAGVGKTVVLKRIAFEMANRGVSCLWVSTPIGEPSLKGLRSVIEEFSESRDVTETIAVFVDVGAYGKRVCKSLVDYFSSTACGIVIVCAIRNSDSLADPTGDLVGVFEVELSQDLSESELSDLPKYLEQIEIAQDCESAAQLLTKMGSKNARDVLCFFWFLVPQTREAISGALSDEYFGLGRIDSTVTAYAEEARRQGATAKKAYELAAVAANIQVPLPTEILVNALRIDYHEWSSFAGEGTPLWGLIYAIKLPEADTVVYQTRNEVVTQHLIQLIDGNSLGKKGQLELIREMISVCDSTLPIYREFLVELLVRKKHAIVSFDFEDQLALYDLAMEVLPSPDRSIAHHRALCLKDIGDDPFSAYEALKEAGEMDASVISESDEAQENIETSAAAAALAAIEKGQIQEEVGADRVRHHVERAINLNPYNLYTYHVSANHLLKLAHRIRQSDASQAAVCLSESARTVRRALSLGVVSQKSPRLNSSEEMLKSLRVRIAQEDLLGEDLREIARQLISDEKFGDPRLEAAIRLMLLKAQDSQKGRDFKLVYDLVILVLSKVEDPLNELNAEFLSIWVEVMTDWKVSTDHTEDTWTDILRVCGSLIQRSGYITNPLWSFWQGVSSFQLGDTHSANAIFHQLRAKQIPGPLKFADRFRYVDSLGNAKNFTGKIKPASHFGGNQYVDVPDLGTDLLCGRGEFSNSSGSTVVINVAFSFAGPRAVKPNL